MVPAWFVGRHWVVETGRILPRRNLEKRQRQAVVPRSSFSQMGVDAGLWRSRGPCDSVTFAQHWTGSETKAGGCETQFHFGENDHGASGLTAGSSLHSSSPQTPSTPSNGSAPVVTSGSRPLTSDCRGRTVHPLVTRNSTEGGPS
jgi:hypothetical protein